MIAPHHVISVPLVSPDATAAMKLRAALDESCAHSDAFAVEPGPVNEIILHGVSELHLEEMVHHLRSVQCHDFQTGAPQIAYRETISKDLQWTYTHTQRHPWQYAKVTLRFFPIGQGAGLEIENTCAGRELPATFFPSVQAGVRDACKCGTYAEIPLTDLKITLVDVDYHATDSSAATFEIAARACVREALPKLRPALLEPIMLVIVSTPQDYMGDVIGDLSSRRGLVQGMDSDDSGQIITALAPFANLLGYVRTLGAMTQGRASHSLTFSHYERVPPGPGGGDDPFAPAMALR